MVEIAKPFLALIGKPRLEHRLSEHYLAQRIGLEGIKCLGQRAGQHFNTLRDELSRSFFIHIISVRLARIEVLFDAFGVEEQYIAETAELDLLVEPAPGVKSWRPYFAGQALVERISMNIADHKRFAAAYADHIEIAYAGADISRIVAEGKSRWCSCW